MYERILVPVDGSPTSDRGLEEAVRLGRLSGGSLRLVHVVDMMTYGVALDTPMAGAGNMQAALRDAGEKILAQCQARARAGGVQADTVLVEGFAGPVAERLVEQVRAWSAQIVVLGTHGRRGVGRFLLGSDAEQFLRISPVPVLLVRAEEATEAPPAPPA